jgi:hypothetical protein
MNVQQHTAKGLDHGSSSETSDKAIRQASLHPQDEYKLPRESIMSNGETYQGNCFCGAVQFKVIGEPAGMGYCQCESCRSWSAGPVNAFTLWKPEAVQITRGADNIGTYNKTPHSYRKWCKTCGGHLFTEHPAWGLTDV